MKSAKKPLEGKNGKRNLHTEVDAVQIGQQRFIQKRIDTPIPQWAPYAGLGCAFVFVLVPRVRPHHQDRKENHLGV